MATALFIRHQSLPGMREDVRRVWEKFVKPRASVNPSHQAYYYCYDDNEADVILVYQQYPDAEAASEFMKGAWYAEYLAAVGQHVAAPPRISTATVVWAKGERESGVPIA